MSCYKSALRQLRNLEEIKNIMIIIRSRVILFILFMQEYVQDVMAVIRDLSINVMMMHICVLNGKIVVKPFLELYSANYYECDGNVWQ